MSPEISGGSEIIPSVENESDTPSLRLKDRQDIGENFAIHAIPVENYLGHFGIDPRMVGPSLTAQAMSREIGTNSKWVSREIMRFQLQPDFAEIPYASGKQEVYRPFVTELIREQYVWQQHFLQLPSHLNMNRIAEEVGRSREWAQRQVSMLGPIPSVYRKGKNKQITVYPRSVVKKLRDINLATPVDNGGVSLTVLSELIGRDYGWIQRRMRKAGLDAEKRRSTITGLINIYYPQSAIDLVASLRAEAYPPAGSWLTVERMSDIIGKSPLWIENRITDEVSERSEVRLDDSLKPSTHYPPEFLEDLKVLCDIFDQLPEANNWLTIKNLVDQTGQDYEWIKRRLAEADLRPEWRRMPAAMREYLYYSPRSLNVIRQAILDREPEANGWLTAHALEALIPKSENWIKLRLKKYRDLAEPRQDSQRVTRLHYPPEILTILQTELDELLENSPAEEWATISTLEARLGMHAVTLTKLMGKIEVESETRLDLKGRTKLHFSPETQIRLAEKAMEVYGYPDADRWVTFSVAQKIIGRSAGWIRSQFNERAIASEVRLDKSRHPLEHFDIEVIEQIKELSDTLDAGSMLSIDDIIEKTQRSRVWVVGQLGKQKVTPEKRFSRFGKFIDHYPESIIDELVNI